MPGRRATLIAFALTLFLASLAPVAASALRCNHRLVLRGDPAARALALCGQPAAIHRTTEFRRTARWIGGWLEEQAVAVPVEYWLYDFGPQRLQQLLEFEAGFLRAEHTLGYGIASSGPGW